jgi:hypothetical protein
MSRFRSLAQKQMSAQQFYQWISWH